MAWPKFRITTSTFLNFILDSLLFGQKYPCPSFNFWLKYLLSIFSSLARNVPCPPYLFLLFITLVRRLFSLWQEISLLHLLLFGYKYHCPPSLWLEIPSFSPRHISCPTSVFSLTRNSRVPPEIGTACYLQLTLLSNQTCSESREHLISHPLKSYEYNENLIVQCNYLKVIMGDPCTKFLLTPAVLGIALPQQ